MPKILIIEDEPAIQMVLRELFGSHGYAVETASDGTEGLSAFQAGEFDLVLLDIMMPKLDGYAVLKRIRNESDTPVILLTALDSDHAQAKGFDLLADDYITKPFSVMLVLKRAEAVLRRTARRNPDEFRCGEILLEPESRRVLRNGTEVSLTQKEFEILSLLLRHPGRVYTRDVLLTRVWGYDFYGDEKTVNIHIMNLRRKLGEDLITTVRGVGYRIDG